MASTQKVLPDTPIAVKVFVYDGVTRRLRIPLKDLTPTTLPAKLRQLLAIPDSLDVRFERFSDSAGVYVTLDPQNIAVYKTLMRAAKAKLKLRLRATLISQHEPQKNGEAAAQPAPPPQRPTAEALASESAATSTAAKKSAAQQEFIAKLHARTRERDLALRMKEPSAAAAPFCSWSVYCNNCDKPMENEHYHCSVCDNGDYDLCEACVKLGIHCPGEGHWLIKRFVNHGTVINSLTRTIPPKIKGKAQGPGQGPSQAYPQPTPQAPAQPSCQVTAPVIAHGTVHVPIKVQAEPAKDMPGAFAEEKPVSVEQQGKSALTEAPSVFYGPCRTCNSCIEGMSGTGYCAISAATNKLDTEYPDERFVTCQDCPDYDLCIGCYLPNRHGHHPGHTFAPASDHGPATNFRFDNFGFRHSAICDGCDQGIHGVRHKCLNCPDWDYCSNCFKSAKLIHPHHRFVPVYDRLPLPRSVHATHISIFCDGPLCQGKPETYIRGVRYKCAVCNDTDFCANCEASPTNRHNRTHPLIMFKTPVRNVSVTTLNEDINAQRTFRLGDKPALKATTTETTVAASSNNSTTQVQTVADLEPTPRPSTRSLGKEKIAIKDLLAEPIKEKMQVKDLLLPMPKEQTNTPSESIKKELPQETKEEPEPKKTESIPTNLNAYFVADDISDGTRVSPSDCFVQTWKLRNPGPNAWPVGCSVRYVGGDNMFNIDHSHPFSANEITNATESNGTKVEVQPGEKLAFSVTMKAPEREGTAISYWRLKAPNGMPFGHKLWCHVVVQKAAPSSPTSDMLDKQTTNEAKEEKTDKPTKEVKENDEVANSSSSLSSQMIFPTLEKESPVNSIHEAAPASSPASLVTQPRTFESDIAAPAPVLVPAEATSQQPEPQAEPELFDDAESVEIVESDSWDEEDGFVTDEEWDVLGASDEE